MIPVRAAASPTRVGKRGISFIPATLHALPPGQGGSRYFATYMETEMIFRMRKDSIPLLAILALITQAGQAYAACSQSEVDHYLSKGFTTDQITSLCTAPPTPQTTGQPDTPAQPAELAVPVPVLIPPPEAVSPAGTTIETPQPAPQSVEQSSGQMAAGDDTEQFLRTAIKGKDILLTNDALHYTLEMCIQYGEEDLFGFTAKTCPDVKFVVGLKGLDVLSTGKEHYLFGTGEVKVQGKIEREIIGQLEDLSPRERRLALKKFEKGDKTVIPIREDISLDRVQAVLEQLAN